MPDLETLESAFAGWRRGEIWVNERMRVGRQTSVAEHRFRLLHSGLSSDVLHLFGSSGHRSSLQAARITNVALESRSISVTEQFSRGASRTSTFRLLALQNEGRTAISQAAHVWFCDCGEVRNLGATEVVWHLENYARGASALNPRLHAKLRRSVERTEHEVVQSSTAAFVKALGGWRTRPIVFWVGASLREQLSFWWACHVTVSTGLKLNAWFAGPENAEVDSDAFAGLQVAPPEYLARMFGDANPLSTRAMQVFASKWRAFVTVRPWAS